MRGLRLGLISIATILFLFCARASAQVCDPCTPDGCPPCPPSCPDLGQPCSMPPPCSGTGVTYCNPQGEELCACTQDCYCPPWGQLDVGGGCAWVSGHWDAPRGSLVLINSPGSTIRSIINAIGETYTHEMVVDGPNSASQSELKLPGSGTCNYPLNVQELTYGYPGMERSLNMGAIYADIYSSVPFRLGAGSSDVIWQLGDAARANAIADAISATATSDDPVHTDYVHRIIRSGSVSPYVLHQYYDIELTHELGPSLYNGSMSASYCAYAYALGGPPMSPFRYDHDATYNAGWALAGAVYDGCRGQVGFWERFFCGGADPVCQAASNMVLNCMLLGDCNNNTAVWQGHLADGAARAWTISPDRLGGHSRFAQEVPLPTSWATDQAEHDVTWSSAGLVYGCYR